MREETHMSCPTPTRSSSSDVIGNFCDKDLKAEAGVRNSSAGACFIRRSGILFDVLAITHRSKLSFNRDEHRAHLGKRRQRLGEGFTGSRLREHHVTHIDVHVLIRAIVVTM